jgi:hypothetical protein
VQVLAQLVGLRFHGDVAGGELVPRREEQADEVIPR